MTKPAKKTGFRQGIYDVSAVQKEYLGLERVLDDGRVFIYCKAGAAALSAGKMSYAPAAGSDVVNKTAPVVAIGARQVVLTITSATYAENYFAGGQLHFNSGTGVGTSYKIESSSAVATGTSIVITTEDPVRVAWDASGKFSLIASPYMATVEGTSQTAYPTGVSPVAVPISNFYWSQIGGPCCCLVAGTPAVGANLTLGGVAGAVGALSATIATTIAQPIVGVMYGTAGVDTEYKPVFIAIGK